MKFSVILCMGALLLPHAAFSATEGGTVLLTEQGVNNLGIEIVTVEEAEFQDTAFALGRIETIPGRTGAVSSRISGKLVELRVSPGDSVTADQIVAEVESRQAGDPPPVIPLRAPLKGLVMHSDARLGDPVEPDKALLEITDLSEVHAVARVPEYQAGMLKPGSKARIQVAALGEKEFEGELIRFGTSADPESGTIDAYFLLPNPDGVLRPGMRAEFSIVKSMREGVLSVPKESLQGNPANRHVYVKHPKIPNAFDRVSVQTGETSANRVEIVDGLYPGDEVVTRGSYSLGFAGQGGGVSLKEAMDAAHGHEHNEDGSEMTPEQAAAKKAAKSGEAGHEHGSAAPAWREKFFMATTALLFVLLVLSSVSKRKGTPELT
ncbi:efflux RND transporter periplasmic adaptor subunit [Luteolibacter flavescens]|uniref:Efflux RND transporter periplasmic adaptor subunit n=1 Tax=Luteolibacter flavescens TaxID=1859460 RepID=A0ABT3FT38_9BACT|nr:efflux RND transporter periplasmic adaptor subunit [Luteolibacter flavescens]MCW1886752.1 efflux RND transporter periplasmic adaptor subunit [Luteolibacter flavescens]